jgi:hypothetical protein
MWIVRLFILFWSFQWRSWMKVAKESMNAGWAAKTRLEKQIQFQML